MTTHVLKTHPDPFLAVFGGYKTAEFRKDDRDYHRGDLLRLREYDPDRDSYSGFEVTAKVTDVRKGGQYGIPDGYAMLSIRITERHTPESS
jgi:hypothetical protein